MKVAVARKEFADALKFVLKAVAVKFTTPILAGIYFKAENSTLELQATDHSLGIISKVPANVEESRKNRQKKFYFCKEISKIF